jgi:hypothetical protein
MNNANIGSKNVGKVYSLLAVKCLSVRASGSGCPDMVDGIEWIGYAVCKLLTRVSWKQQEINGMATG